MIADIVTQHVAFTFARLLHASVRLMECIDSCNGFRQMLPFHFPNLDFARFHDRITKAMWISKTLSLASASTHIPSRVEFNPNHPVVNYCPHIFNAARGVFDVMGMLLAVMQTLRTFPPTSFEWQLYYAILHGLEEDPS